MYSCEICGTGFTRKSNFESHAKTNKNHTLLLEPFVGKIGRVEDRIKYRPWGCPRGHNSVPRTTEEFVAGSKDRCSVTGNSNFPDVIRGTYSKLTCCYFTSILVGAESMSEKAKNSDLSESTKTSTAGADVKII